MKCVKFLSAFALVVGMAQSAYAVTANGGFEFEHLPKLDGAGYLEQPVFNTRSTGAMAYGLGESIAAPLGPYSGAARPGPVAGQMTYSAEDGIWATMSFDQDSGDGGDGMPPSMPPIQSPLNGQKNLTLEARFRVRGARTGQAEQSIFNLRNDAFGSVHFDVHYGARGGADGLYFSGTPDFGSVAMPIGYGGYVKLRVVTDEATRLVSTYLDLEDGNGFIAGPTGIDGALNRDEGTQARGPHPGNAWGATSGINRTRLDMDYIRWSFSQLSTSDTLQAVPEPSTLSLLGLAGLALLRRRR